MSREGGSLKSTYCNKCQGVSQQGACQPPLDGPHGVPEPRRVPAGVEGDQIRKAGPPCGHHGEQWHRSVDSLAMHEVPFALSDHSRNPGGEVVISPSRPGRDTQDRDALNDLLPWQPPGPVGCEHGDFETPQRGEATGNLMDVHLSAAGFREVTRADHEYAEWPLQRLVSSMAERLAGSYITYHELRPARKRLRGALRLRMP